MFQNFFIINNSPIAWQIIFKMDCYQSYYHVKGMNNLKASDKYHQIAFLRNCETV